MTRTFDAIVIGSGPGGLTAGALYAGRGHQVLVLERAKHFSRRSPRPGGHTAGV
jgi:phytoene dehydrogenase-like protein